MNGLISPLNWLSHRIAECGYGAECNEQCSEMQPAGSPPVRRATSFRLRLIRLKRNKPGFEAFATAAVDEYRARRQVVEAECYRLEDDTESPRPAVRYLFALPAFVWCGVPRA